MGESGCAHFAWRRSEGLLANIRRVVDDPNVTVEPLNAGVPRGQLFADEHGALRRYPRSFGKVFPRHSGSPSHTSGYTENQRYRPLGINAYGFNPYTATEEEGNTEHGNDERIRVEEVRRGPRIMFDVVAAVAEGK